VKCLRASETLLCCVVTDDLAQAFAAVSEGLGDVPPGEGVDRRPDEAVSYQQQQPYPGLPPSAPQGTIYPPGTAADYPPGTAPSVYPGASARMMVGQGRDFNPPRVAGFQMDSRGGKVYQPGPSQVCWQPGLPACPAGLPPAVSQGDFRPEFHPHLESGAPEGPQA